MSGEIHALRARRRKAERIAAAAAHHGVTAIQWSKLTATQARDLANEWAPGCNPSVETLLLTGKIIGEREAEHAKRDAFFGSTAEQRRAERERLDREDPFRDLPSA